MDRKKSQEGVVDEVWIKLMDEIWKTSMFATLSTTALPTFHPQQVV
jgi:hypothetical protein